MSEIEIGSSKTFCMDARFIFALLMNFSLILVLPSFQSAIQEQTGHYWVWYGSFVGIFIIGVIILLMRMKQ